MARLAVVVPLRRCAGEDVDLAVVQPEILIDARDLRLESALIGQEDPRGAALDDGGRDERPVDIGQRLGGEDDGGVLLPERLQPFAQLPAEVGVIEGEPALVDQHHRGAPVEPGLDPVEEIGQHGGSHGRTDQPFGLEGQHIGRPEFLRLGIQKPAEGAAETEGLQRAFEFGRLQQDREAGECALLARGRGERGQRRPEMIPRCRVDRRAFTPEDSREPILRPGAFRRLIDPCERLQLHRWFLVGQCIAEILPIPAHGERGAADRAAEVEGEDLRARVTAELQRHQC